MTIPRPFLTLTMLLIAACSTAQHHPRFDATNPDVHDPVMAQGEDGRYYIFSTGMGISVMSSADLMTWRQEPGVFTVTASMPDGREFTSPGNAPLPAWTTDSVKGFHGHIWAPDISRRDGRWYLYYSCSTFGKNGSAIGVAVNKTLDPASPDFRWEDHGAVIVSHKHVDDYNCIDPDLAPLPSASTQQPSASTRQPSANTQQPSASTRQPSASTLFFGSFWDGIQMLPLAADLKTPLSHPATVARRYAPAGNAETAAPYIDVVGNDTVEAGENAIEAPFCIYNNGWYYLLVSWDYCCRGQNSTYKTVYGRSRSIDGPYLDKKGRDMAVGGGTLLVGPDDKYYGVGHCSAYELTLPDGTRQWYFLSHAYDKAFDGQSKLFMRKFGFTADGWIEME